MARMEAFFSHWGLVDKLDDTVVEPVRVKPRGVTMAIKFSLEVLPNLSVFEIVIGFGFRQETYGSGLGSRDFAGKQNTQRSRMSN